MKKCKIDVQDINKSYLLQTIFQKGPGLEKRACMKDISRRYK